MPLTLTQFTQKIVWSVGGLSVLALAGCTVVGPTVQELTDPVVPPVWSDASLKVDPAGSLSDYATFWSRWNNPTIMILINKALQNNTDILQAKANVLSAQAELTRANSQLWPSASLSGQVARNYQGGQTATAYTGSVSGNWSFNLAGAEYFTSQAAQSAFESKVYSLADTQEIITSQVVQAYINLCLANENLSLAKQTLLAYEQTLEVAKWQELAGTGEASSVEDAQSQLASTRARIPQIQQSITQYRNVLVRLTGATFEQIRQLPAQTLPVPPEHLSISVPAKLLERRPDVRAALASLQSAVQSVKSAKSSFFPSLGLTGSIGTSAMTIGALGLSGTGIGSLIAALSAPVLNWGSLIANEKSAVAQLDASRAQYVAVLLSALEQTDNALSGIKHARERMSDLTQAVEHAKEAEKLARYSYEAGTGEYLTLISAQRSLLSAQESELSNRAELANSVVTLYQAIGGSWAVNDEQKSMQKDEK